MGGTFSPSSPPSRSLSPSQTLPWPCSHWVQDVPDNLSCWGPELRAHFSTPKHPKQLASPISIPRESERAEGFLLSLNPFLYLLNAHTGPGSPDQAHPTAFSFQPSLGGTSQAMRFPEHHHSAAQGPAPAIPSSYTASFSPLAWIICQAALADQPEAPKHGFQSQLQTQHSLKCPMQVFSEEQYCLQTALRAALETFLKKKKEKVNSLVFHLFCYFQFLFLPLPRSSHPYAARGEPQPQPSLRHSD